MQRDEKVAVATPAFTVGRAADDADRGWFVGQFVPPEGGLRRTADVEIKWGVHPGGDGDVRREWAEARAATTASILIEGRFVVRLRANGRVHEVRLEERGDYVIFGPGVPHTWEAPEAALVLTVRFPSIPDDVLVVPD